MGGIAKVGEGWRSRHADVERARRAKGLIRTCLDCGRRCASTTGRCRRCFTAIQRSDTTQRAHVRRRLLAKASRRGRCLEWTGGNRNGYGQITIAEQKRQVTRVALEAADGPIPDGLHVLHTCDNPPCFRRRHLFLGTRSDNMQDMVRKGRHARQHQRSVA
jgi:hypothetical protein